MLSKFLSEPSLFGLIVVSGIGGAIGAFVLYLVFVWMTDAKTEKLRSREFLYSGVLTGIVERFFFTTMIGLLGENGIPQAVIAWIAIKGQVHYRMFTETRDAAQLGRAYAGLLGSMASIVFAVAGGYLWFNQRDFDWLWNTVIGLFT